MDATALSQPFTPKSFWKRPEGVTGMVFMAAIVGAALYGFSLILPWILTLLEETVYAAGLFAVIAVFFFIVTQKRFWTLGSYFFKAIMYHLTNLFITIDPIAILKGYVSTLRDKLVELNNQTESVRGQMRALQEKIEKNKADIAKSMGMVKAAKESGKQLVMVKNARSAGRKQESNMTYDALYKRMEAIYRVLVKYSEASEFLIEDIQGQVDEAIEKKKMIDKASKAMSAAKKILAGAGDETTLYNETMEYLADDYGQKLGEIEHFMDMSKSTLEGIDIENMSYEEDAFKQLDVWEKKTDSLILGDNKQSLLTEGGVDFKVPVSRDRVTIAAGDGSSSTGKFIKPTHYSTN